MGRMAVTRIFVMVVFAMLTVLPVTVFASSKCRTEVAETAALTVVTGTDEEPTLQEWFDANGYAINVSEDELVGIEEFEAGYYQISILAEIAGYASLNNLSWYPISSGELHLIFSGTNSTGDVAVFLATEKFGLCLGTPDGLYGDEPNTQLFYTETERNPDGFDHALIFTNPNPSSGYIIVWEDLWEGGDEDFQDMILAMLTPVINAEVCIRPLALNLKSRGRWITCFLRLPRGFNVEDIDVSTITLNGTVPAEPRPVTIFRDSNSDCEDDGVQVLMVKFNRTLVIEYIKNAIAPGGIPAKRFDVTLVVSGNLLSGQIFEGSTKIRIVHFLGCIKGRFRVSLAEAHRVNCLLRAQVHVAPL